MNRKDISLVILDLDNTLYDWVSFFVPSLYAMIKEAAKIIGCEESEIVNDLKKVHQKHHNTEQPFALLETDVVLSKYPHKNREELTVLLDSAFHIFNKERKKRLNLYSDILVSLNRIKKNGAILVAHSEATVSNSVFRLEALEVIELFEKIYVPPTRGKGHPNPQQSNFKSRYPNKLKILPADHRKPDETVINDISLDFGALKSEILYIGDSLSKDILMARRSGVNEAWAKYGRNFSTDLWDDLVAVSHWTNQDIKTEEEIRKQSEGLKPKFTLNEFSDVFDAFNFIPLKL